MLVDSQQDMAVSWEAGDGAQAAAFAVERCPDVMLMDLRMPVLDGVGATQRIVQQAEAAGTGAPKIIALTTFNRDQAVVDAVHAGASGYLLKSAEPEFLLAAIRTVYSGYSVIAPGSVQALFQHAARTLPAGGPDLSVLEVLSARERDVFLLAAKGLGQRRDSRKPVRVRGDRQNTPQKRAGQTGARDPASAGGVRLRAPAVGLRRNRWAETRQHGRSVRSSPSGSGIRRSAMRSGGRDRRRSRSRCAARCTTTSRAGTAP